MEKRPREKLNVYQGLIAEFKKLIELGAIGYGEKLPSCRALAYERGINPNTVEKAYSALEAEGYIRILPKKGAYVDFIDDRERKRLNGIKTQLQILKDAGVTRAELERLADEIYAEDCEEDMERNDRN